MPKDIYLISAYCDPCSDNNLRVNNVYKYSKESNFFNPIILTTDFNHSTKSKHDKNKAKLETIFIKVPEYKTNFSLRRIYSHWFFAFKIYSFFKKIKSDEALIYCTIPTASAALACILAKPKNVRFAIDVIDIWPESFVALFRSKEKFLNLILFPWKKLSTYVYSKAHIIFAESHAYGDLAKKHNSSANVHPVYLGIDTKKYESQIKESKVHLEKNSDELIITYGGSLGNSYDFETLLTAYSQLKSKKIKLIFVGDGEKRTFIEQFASKHNLDIFITGFVTYSDYLKYLSFSDIAMNCFNSDTAVVHSYKFNDYALSGLAILNSLRGETDEMINQYNIGINYNSVESLIDAINILYNDRELLEKIKSNSTAVANNVLSCDILYPKMVNTLKEFAYS